MPLRPMLAGHPTNPMQSAKPAAGVLKKAVAKLPNHAGRRTVWRSVGQLPALVEDCFFMECGGIWGLHRDVVETNNPA